MIEVEKNKYWIKIERSSRRVHTFVRIIFINHELKSNINKNLFIEQITSLELTYMYTCISLSCTSIYMNILILRLMQKNLTT